MASGSTYSGPGTDRDGDSDRRTKSFFDSDDGERRDFGRAADVGERRAIRALLRRYYAALAVGDGGTICSLVASDLNAALVIESGRPPGTAVAADCARGAAELLKGRLGRSAKELNGVEVVGARVEGDMGVGLLRLTTAEARYIPLLREVGVWKVNALLDGPVG